MLAIACLAVAGCAARPEPAPRQRPETAARVEEAVSRAPEPRGEAATETGGGAAPEEAAGPAREVRVVAGRPPEIEVLARFAPQRTRLTGHVFPGIAVVGADLEAGTVLLRDSQWAGYARSADYVESLVAVPLSKGRPRRVLHAAGREHVSGAGVLGIGGFIDITVEERDDSFEGCLKRIRLGEGLAVEDVLCRSAWVTDVALLADPTRDTAVWLTPSGVRGARDADIGVLWFRLSDGEVLAERALPPYSHVELVADGPLLVSSHDPDIYDGYRATDDVLTLLDLASGARVELVPDLVGGHLRGIHRAEQGGEEALLVVRQADAGVMRFEVVRIDLASALPE